MLCCRVPPTSSRSTRRCSILPIVSGRCDEVSDHEIHGKSHLLTNTRVKAAQVRERCPPLVVSCRRVVFECALTKRRGPAGRPVTSRRLRTFSRACRPSRTGEQGRSSVTGRVRRNSPDPFEVLFTVPSSRCYCRRSRGPVLQVDNKRSGAHAGITEAVVPERRYGRGVFSAAEEGGERCELERATEELGSRIISVQEAPDES